MEIRKARWLLPVLIGLALLSDLGASQNQPPVTVFRPAPVYPYALLKKRVNGHVVVEFIVEKDGLVRQAHIVESSNPGFDASVVAAVLRWKFQPGLKDGKPVNVRAQQSLDFSVPVHRQVYPFELLMAGTTGKARLGYWVNEDRHLLKVEVLEATDPAFGKAAQAVLEDDLSTSPEHLSKPEKGRYETNFEFDRKDASETSFLDPSAREILKLLKKKDPGICEAGELDAPPAAVMKLNPVFPFALLATRTSGEAVVEFFIDRQGKAQLPRVVSATHEDFGYAAAQAAGQWQFEPPLRAGKPVIVRVRQTMPFNPDWLE